MVETGLCAVCISPSSGFASGRISFASPGLPPIPEELEAEHDDRKNPREVRKIQEAIDICAKVLPQSYMKPYWVQPEYGSLVLANVAMQSEKVFLTTLLALLGILSAHLHSMWNWPVTQPLLCPTAV